MSQDTYGIDSQGGRTSTHALMLDYIKSWVEGTRLWRMDAKQDLDYVNGKQGEALKPLISKMNNRQPTITNEIRPQVELMAGLQRARDFQFMPTPRAREDQRLSDICTAVLKAVFDYAKEARCSAKVFDDGTASGLGASYVGTTLDDADDIVWGDLFIERINQFAFIFDPWGTTPDFQDGEFMGHLRWMTEASFRKTYPEHAIPPRSDWQDVLGHGNFGENPSLQAELLDGERGQIRIAMLYYRVPTVVWFVIDESNGDVYEGAGSEKAAKRKMQALVKTQADTLMEDTRVSLPQITQQGAVFFILDGTDSPQIGPDGQPTAYLSHDAAVAAIAAQRTDLMTKLKDTYSVQKRHVTTIHWAKLTAFGILEEGIRDPTARRFPYSVYVQRQWGDDVQDIEGLARQVKGRQDQVNKRNNFIDLNLAHSANSGWLNKKQDGADTKQLELFGSQPGVVVEWGSVRPEQIQAAQIPVGHFTVLQDAITGIPRATGVNNELLGLTSNSTVSGRAITARQQGGQLIVLPRMEGFSDYKLDLALNVVEEVQMNMPLKKIRRIVGAWDAKQPGESIFFDPVSGTEMNDTGIMALLTAFKSTRFDLAFSPQAPDESARQMEFTRQLEIAQLITSSQRQIGSSLFAEILETANVSAKFKSAALKDLQAEIDTLAAQSQGGQLAQLLNDQRGRGSDGTNQG